MPPTEVWPRLYVLDDQDFTRAQKLVDEGLVNFNADSDGHWLCAKCGEEVDNSFEICWNCNAARLR